MRRNEAGWIAALRIAFSYVSSAAPRPDASGMLSVAGARCYMRPGTTSRPRAKSVRPHAPRAFGAIKYGVFGCAHHHRYRHARDECCGHGRSPQVVYAHPVGSRTGFWVMVSLRLSRSGPTAVAWFLPPPSIVMVCSPPRGTRCSQPPTLAPGPPAFCCVCAGWA